MKKTGYFITFEGIDGCGKSTQLKNTKKYLVSMGYTVVVFREPGSTPLSERIRDIILDKKLTIGDFPELMLYLAARAELVGQVIDPTIKKGKIVLCDRFFDSTTAYQGYGRGLDINLINKLNRLAVGEVVPNLTFLIDLNFRTSLARRNKENKCADRLESESGHFFHKVKNGFLEIARRNKSRVKVIDGSPDVETVFEEVKYWLNRKLKI